MDRLIGRQGAGENTYYRKLAAIWIGCGFYYFCAKGAGRVGRQRWLGFTADARDDWQGALGRRRTFDGLIDQFLPGTYDPPAFQLRHAHKDVSLAVALGKEVSVPMRACNLTLEEMTEALNRGWAERDSRSAMLLQQERAGVTIAVDAEKIAAVVKAGDG